MLRASRHESGEPFIGHFVHRSHTDPSAASTVRGRLPTHAVRDLPVSPATRGVGPNPQTRGSCCVLLGGSDAPAAWRGILSGVVQTPAT